MSDVHTSQTVVEVNALDPDDTFDYSTIEDRVFAEKLSRYPLVIRASKEKALSEICSIGWHLSNAQEHLKGRFRVWCKQALGEFGRSTAYSYISTHKAFGELCPTVGHIHPTTLAKLSGPQFDDLRSDVIERLQGGKPLCSKDVQKEMAGVRAAKKAERAAAAGSADISDDVEDATKGADVNTLVDLLEKHIPHDMQPIVIDLIGRTDPHLLCELYYARKKVTPGSY